MVVVETPYFGRTDAAGQLRLELPDGEHLLKAWRPMQVEPVAAVERRVRGGTPVQLSLAAAPGV